VFSVRISVADPGITPDHRIDQRNLKSFGQTDRLNFIKRVTPRIYTGLCAALVAIFTHAN
jgi:hypothetical protein